jgi:protein-tyrosine-phosphatase/predicted ATP-grasp superfamily ATP-dependent carboligase
MPHALTAELPRPRPSPPAPAPETGLPRRALVLGDDTRSFLAVVRSLGRAGWEVHAAPWDFSSPALTSRYLSGVHRLPAYSLGAEKWVAALGALIEEAGIGLVVPCDDRGLIPLHRHSQELPGGRLALPNAEAITVFFDKGETRALAQRLGVPVAPGRVLGAADDAALLSGEFGLPLALKPRSSYRLGQAGAKESVQIVRSEAALAKALGRISNPENWLVEGFFQGEGVGLSVLAEHGVVRLAFQHRRLHEASETGGSSSRVSEPVDSRFLQAVEAMAAATALHGVAMFEFRRVPETGDFILLEVNARFWGSLPLAVAAGADFPAAAAALYAGEPLPDSGRYELSVVRRDLGGEYYRVLKEADATASLPSKLFSLAGGLGGVALSLTRGRSFDSYAADDPAPWQADRKALVAHFGEALAGRLTPPSWRRRRGQAALRKARRRLEEGRRTVVMLCHGNICRSPFAGERLRSLAREAGLDLEIVSAGTIGLEGRASPPEALAAAREWQEDLGSHRSSDLDLAVAEDAAAVVVFDQKNVEEVRRLGLAGRVNLLRLSDLIGRTEISDPYGHGAEGFSRAYAEIDAAVRILAKGIAR